MGDILGDHVLAAALYLTRDGEQRLELGRDGGAFEVHLHLLHNFIAAQV